MRVPTTQLKLHEGSVAGGEAEVEAGGDEGAGAKLGSRKELHLRAANLGTWHVLFCSGGQPSTHRIPDIRK